MMNTGIRSTAVALALLVLCTTAEAAKPCEELKAEIAAKIEAKGVKTYTLEIVPADAASDAKVVGTCDGGASKIVYKRG